MVPFFVIFALIIIGSILTLILATYRGRSPIAWFCLSLFISPIIAIIILFFLKDRSSEVKVKLTEAEQKELNKIREEEKIINKEKKRTSIEKYKIKKIGGWKVLPWIASFIFLIYFLFVGKNNVNVYLIVTIFPIFFLMVLAIEAEDSWEQKLKCKHKIYTEDNNYKWIAYNNEYIYTDSVWNYAAYITAKVISYLVSFIIVGFAGILLFIWIGSISIAPTTIIIILLIIIIINQNRGR